jgi:hypothetical protein
MVVVDHARKLIGKLVEISVTSVLQTASGKMIFGKMESSVQETGIASSHAPEIKLV